MEKGEIMTILEKGKFREVPKSAKVYMDCLGSMLVLSEKGFSVLNPSITGLFGEGSTEGLKLEEITEKAIFGT